MKNNSYAFMDGFIVGLLFALAVILMVFALTSCVTVNVYQVEEPDTVLYNYQQPGIWKIDTAEPNHLWPAYWKKMKIGPILDSSHVDTVELWPDGSDWYHRIDTTLWPRYRFFIDSCKLINTAGWDNIFIGHPASEINTNEFNYKP